MTQDVWLVDRWRPPTYRRAIRYRSRPQLSFPEAADLAAAARRVGGSVHFVFQDRMRPATDAFQLFLLGVLRGDALEFVVAGPTEPEGLKALDEVLGRLNADGRRPGAG